jgi:hypothetical protein
LTAVLKPPAVQAFSAHPVTLQADALSLREDVIIAAMRQPGFTLTRGQLIAFSSATVTDGLAEALSMFMDTLPNEVRQNITVTVYGQKTASAGDILKKHNITVTSLSELPKQMAAAVVVYNEGEEALSVNAEHTRFVELASSTDGSLKIIAAADILFAVFQMPFKQFVLQHGTTIGLLEEEQEALFADADSYEGRVIIKPVDKKQAEGFMKRFVDIAA